MIEKSEVEHLWTGQRVFWSVFTFFAVVMAVNAVFIYLALESHPGVVTEHSYEEGLAFDDRLAEAKEQAKLGWSGQVDLSQSGYIIYRLVDRDQKPVSAKNIKINFVRGVSAGHDFEVDLNESEIGVYRADFNAPLKGKWQAHISVIWDEDGVPKKYLERHDVIVE